MLIIRIAFLVAAWTGVARADDRACAAALGDPLNLRPWITELAADFAPAGRVVPPSFRTHPLGTRVRNELFLVAMRARLNALPPDWADAARELGAPLRESFARLGGAPFGWAVRGSLYHALLELTRADDAASILGQTLVDLRAHHAEFKDDLANFKATYDPALFTDEVVSRGLINVQTMKLFALVDGRRQIPSRAAANAIAFLHPLTDEALDKGTASRETMTKLSERLERGVPPVIETPFERILFGLLGDIERDFPAPEHPRLHAMLRALQRAQLRSVRGGVGEAELIALTFEKGGLSTVIAGYLALGRLARPQEEFFFKAGAVFQVMDDLIDIDVDLGEGGDTVWTTALRANRPLAPTLERFLALERGFERALPRLMPAFGDGKFAAIYTFAFRLTLMRALSRNTAHFARRETQWLRRYFPISFTSLRAFFRATAGAHSRVPADVREIIRASEAY